MDIGLINQRVKDALAEQREYLNLSGMGLPKVPDEVLRATFLKTLDLSNNKLEEIPLEIGNLKLTEVRLAGNPNLRLPPPEVIREGTPAILSFLRSLQEGSKVVRHGKVIVIGDGRAGKTSLIKRLVSNTFSLVENPTLHINVVHLDRPHDQDRTNLRLHIWDFGGQEIFQTTHLHFLTDDSLVLLVWNVQSDQSGKGVRNWLERIDNSAPKARILLVATHADVPELTIRVSLDEFRTNHRQPDRIANETLHLVSSKNGFGIDELNEALIREAARLHQMNLSLPTTWLNAASTINGQSENFLSWNKFSALVKGCNVPEAEERSLAAYLNTTGQILWFHKPKLGRAIDVILKPDVVTDLISKLLRVSQDSNAQGILSIENIRQQWRTIEVSEQDSLLKLMESDLGLVKHTPDNNSYLVIEGLPTKKPPLTRWDKLPEHFRAISMKFYTGELTSLVMAQLLVNLYGKSTIYHWRNGIVQSKSQQRFRDMALVEAFQTSQPAYLRLTVKGIEPHAYFYKLNGDIEQILGDSNRVRRTVSCPGHNNERCGFEFELEHVEKADKDGHKVIQCHAKLEEVSVKDMLVGLAPITPEEVLANAKLAKSDLVITITVENRARLRDEMANSLDNDDIKTICFDLGVGYENIRGEEKSIKIQSLIEHFQKRGRLGELLKHLDSVRPRQQQPSWWHIAGSKEQSRDQYADLIELAHTLFLRRYKKHRSMDDISCPMVFTLIAEEMNGIDEPTAALKLCCEYPGEWHSLEPKYPIDRIAEKHILIRKLEELALLLLPYLQTYELVCGPWIAASDNCEILKELFEKEIENFEGLLSKEKNFWKLIIDDLSGQDPVELKNSLGDIGLPLETENPDANMHAAEADIAVANIDPKVIAVARESHSDVSALIALREFLHKIDPKHHWSGLQKVATDDGDTLWLCEHHAKIYRGD